MPEPSTPTTDALERELHIDARPETVFGFLVDAERLVRWMGRTAVIEPRPGGRFRVDYNGSDIVAGEVLEVDPPRRLVLTWGWEAPGDPVPPGASQVEFTLEPEGAGTRLRLRHSGLPSASLEGHAIGWDQFLPGLATVAGAAGAG